MIAMTLAEISSVVGGRVDGDPTHTVTGAAYVDSRHPEPGGLFVAVVGEHSDGHDFAAHAHAVLGSRPTGRPTVVVDDPVVALAALARHVVRQVRPRVLAVTGSQGKTGAKDLLAAVLTGSVATRGNLNNELGVPLTCLRLAPDSTHLVLEMGARGVGHLAWLCDIARPDVAAVTAVGTAHVGEFGSPELIALAKGELVEALAPDGVAVLNADDAAVLAMASRTGGSVLTYGARAAVSWREMTLDERGRASFTLCHAGRSERVRLQVVGRHQVANATAAAAMALAVDVPLALVAARLSSAAPASPHRCDLRERADGLLVLDDTYNANPASVRAALDTLVALSSPRAGRPVAVLGEMRELGAASHAAHLAVGEHARSLGVGVLAVGAAASAYGGVPVADLPAALAWLQADLRPDDTVLLKASRGVGLDRLVADLLA
ncbi:MAG: UDP-N-acetylmuramoyl-tripeptide--D-alanyl-D-alanine ligase [Actinobacteria bacterium]|uniref:UDP-MurNAc-pentapeptide synthetase n=1 Tax=freshwater metagenome TaxID=449393 RepID=A0A6J6PS76_9ZZZZ|nr:UDP-N-acetylmuramoyl-tripeptide--D-alanyl-D-alanine ligase [Actinomycetota bacterium]